MFQFHKGTIKTHKLVNYFLFSTLFQFHKGTIKTLRLFRNNPLIIRFNSIKVRLKPRTERDGLPASTFQFHKGTIKTEDKNGEYSFDKQFQFHKGTIKTNQDQRDALLLACFNSIKVRLKRRYWRRLAQQKQRFNSIKVRLKHKVVYNLDELKKFQFHKGTIKTHHRQPPLSRIRVSIP